MTDRLDVDNDVMPDDTRLNHDFQRMQRASDTPATNEQGDLMDLPGSYPEGFATPTHESLDGRDPKETTSYTQMMSLEKLKQLPSFIGLSPRPRKVQQEPDSMNVEGLPVRLEAKRKDNETLEKMAKKSGSKVQLLESQIDLVKRVNAKLQQENQDHVEEIKRSMESCEAMRKIHEAEKQGHLETIAQLNDQIKTLTSTSDQLRQMLVPVTEKQVSDSDIVSKFTSLRSGIRGLVRQTWKLALKEEFEPRLMAENQRGFFTSFPVSYDRLRFLVSDAIRIIIFDSQNYFLGDSFQELERRIQKVERELARTMPKEYWVRIIEWRNATFKVTETFRGTGSELSSTAQDEIWDFLSPLQLKDAAAEQKGQEKLKAVCDNAVELNLMMRQLKDDFWFDDVSLAVGTHTTSEWGMACEVVESLAADDDHPPETIAYVITGALMKRPKENMENILVLEKAEVAVYE